MKTFIMNQYQQDLRIAQIIPLLGGARGGSDVMQSRLPRTHPLPLPRGECAVDLSNHLRKSWTFEVSPSHLVSTMVGRRIVFIPSAVFQRGSQISKEDTRLIP